MLHVIKMIAATKVRDGAFLDSLCCALLSCPLVVLLAGGSNGRGVNVLLLCCWQVTAVAVVLTWLWRRHSRCVCALPSSSPAHCSRSGHRTVS